MNKYAIPYFTSYILNLITLVFQGEISRWWLLSTVGESTTYCQDCRHKKCIWSCNTFQLIFALFNHHMTLMQKHVWCSAALNMLNMLVVEVQCLFVSLHVTSSLQGNPFSYVVVLYIPNIVWHRSPSRVEFQENSSVMLSQGRQVLLSQAQIFILHPGVSLGHKESNKTEQFSFNYSLYLQCRLKYKHEMTILHLAPCQHVELFMEPHFIMFLWSWIPLFARYDKWECENMHHKHTSRDSCTAHNSTLLYYKIK